MKKYGAAFITTILLLFSLTSCLYKNVNTGNADNVLHSEILEREDNLFLLNFESLFQAASKEYKNGTYYITGHNDYRISIYSMEDGNLAERKKVKGDFIPFIGKSRNTIWLYDKKRGVYGLDEFTLEKVFTMDDLDEKYPELPAPFITCDYTDAWQYYAMGPEGLNLILTNNQGNRYMMDTLTLELKYFDQEIFTDPWSRFKSDSGIQKSGKRLDLEGDLRQKLVINGKDLLDGESFLSGEFIAENEGDYTEEDNLIFILHKESIEEKAKVQISCIKKDSADKYRKTWTLTADGLYFDVSIAEGSSFKQVISKGNPEFSYKWFEKSGNNLCFIYMLHAGCINIDSGKLTWLKRL